MIGEKVKIILLTGRSLKQGVSKEMGKTSQRYFDGVAVCELDPGDLKKLGLKGGEVVRVTTKYGSVLVKATASPNAPHPGVAFIPYGPYANLLTKPDTECSGMPSFKGLEAEVEQVSEEKVPTIEELVSMFRRRG